MTREKLSLYARFAIAVVTIGGFLFGFYAAIITGALCFICSHFSLSHFQESSIVSALLLGACLGTFLAGYLTGRVGRKLTIITAAFFFIFGAIVFILATHFLWLVLGRTLAGCAIGLISVSVPLYLAEISPPHSRGRIVALNTLAVTIGIFISYLVNYLFSKTGDWRAMFMVGIPPAIFLAVGMFFFPETPEWLISHKGVEKTREVFRRLRKDTLWQSRLEEMKRASSQAKELSRGQPLFTPALRFSLFIGIMIHVFQQITGINGIIFFAPKIFESAGFDLTSTAIFATLGVGAVNLLATPFALWFVDRAGRRPLLLLGIGGMALSLIVLSTAFYFESSFLGIIAVVSLLAYIGFFAIGLGPIAWLLTSEIYPLGVRGKAMSLVTLVNWTCGFLSTHTFLGMMRGFGSEGTFFLFAAISLLALFFVYQYVPETKGKSLEEIERSLASSHKSGG